MGCEEWQKKREGPVCLHGSCLTEMNRYGDQIRETGWGWGKDAEASQLSAGFGSSSSRRGDKGWGAK